MFIDSGRLDRWIVAVEERVTDLLNQRETLRICTDPAADRWSSVDRDDLLLVASPPMPMPTGRAIHRQKRRVLAQVGPYSVEGIVHMPPGMPLDPFLLRTRQHFLPLTRAVVSSSDASESGDAYQVVLVNVFNVSELRLLVRRKAAVLDGPRTI
jgi:hypothetical protein